MSNKVDNARDKVYVLLQVSLDGSPIDDWNQRQELTAIYGIASRLARCMSGKLQQ
jgi:hypothetical protein